MYVFEEFDPANVPHDLDAIIIGSGIGGLMPAATLSRAGWKVCLSVYY
jgi:choline dehydrogenase-like flavoprotein